MFEFTETLTIEVPQVEEQVSAFSEKEYKANHGLIIEVAAIHEGMTANFNFYPAAALESALQSWVAPYPKPIIMNHDPYSEPVGRVMAAKMEKEADGTPFTRLQVAITDPEAISKVLDQRYLTGSVGGKAEEANCSVCGADWAKASMANLPCRHQRGKTYKGKLAYMEMNGISFKEYSFVNMPADQRSNIRSIATNAAQEGTDVNDENEGWVRSARVFALDMNNEEILEFSESVGNRNVLEGMKKKEATPVYMNLKGAFLSALAVNESERVEESAVNDKESDVDPKLVQEEEDILAVTEGLATDLATPAEETTATEAADEEGEDKNDDAEASDEEESSEEEAPAEDKDDADENSEGDKPEGQEAPKDKDVDPEDSKGAPVSREEDDEDEEDSDDSEDETAEEGEAADEATTDETDLDEATQALESRVEELEAREQTLLEENAKLKSALKHNLAERVVDMKIALGMSDADKRDELLEDHVKRSASSLADSLRDFATMPAKVTEGYTAIPEVTEESAAVVEDDTVTEGDLEDNDGDDELTAEQKAEEGLYKLLNGAVLN